MVQWFFADIESFEPEVGFETHFNVAVGGRDYLHLWKVTDVRPGERIVCDWKYGGSPGEILVAFELSEFSHEHETACDRGGRGGLPCRYSGVHARGGRAGVTFAVHYALLLSRTGASREAVAAVRQAVELVPYDASGYYWLAYVLWEGGAVDDVPAVLDAFVGVQAETHNVTFPFWENMLAAEGALRTGDLDLARESLALAAAHPRAIRDHTVEAWLRARLAEARGDAHAAIDAYAGVVRTYRWYTEAHTLITLEARYRRACLQQDTGDSGFDRAVLEELVEAWGETGLAMVEEARRRLAR